MTDPLRQPRAPMQLPLVPICRWLWKQRGFVWGTVVIGLILNLFATWPNTPLGAIFGHPLLSALAGLGLLALTGGLWLINHLNPSPVSQNAPARPITQRDRQALVHLLRQDYQKRLAQSLQGATTITLGLQERTDVIYSSAQLVFHRTSTAPASALPSGTSIAQVYDDAGQGLFILGAPGAGKTTLLLDLALELLARIQSDSVRPIPVILNLSSWGSKELPLATWLVDQFRLVYGLPAYFGQALLNQDQWIVLLDGLDEVEASARSRCIEAINVYRGEHFAPLVVCSRSHEYLSQEARLVLSSAVEIQPLQEREVVEYLKRIGRPTSAVRAALRTNPALKQLLTTPLMLSVMILAYREKTVKDLPTLGSAEEQQRWVFTCYVERMLEQLATWRVFTPQQTCQWLIWLAQHMSQRHSTEFYLEQLQPTWLGAKRLQILYTLLFVLVVGLIAGLIATLSNGLITLLAIGLLGYVYGHAGPHGVVLVDNSLVYGITNDLEVGLIVGLTFGLFFGWQFIYYRKGEIRQAEVLIWSWGSFWFIIAIGLAMGFGVKLYYGLGLGTFMGLVGLFNALFYGLSARQISEYLRIRPNQGIQISRQYALRIWLTVGLIVGLTVGLIIGLFDGPFDGLTNGPIIGLIAGLFAGLFYGGAAYLQHYILRFLFWRSGAMPWHYTRFLEAACECILLQRVGGGYRFIHPRFQEFFASQSIRISPNSPQPPLSRL